MEAAALGIPLIASRAGGMADVSLAEDTVLDRLVALKRLRSVGDHGAVARLRREALVGASLSHPNLVSVYDVWEEEDGDLVIVMEYVEGSNLRDLVRTHGALPTSRALRILAGVAAASVHLAHQASAIGQMDGRRRANGGAAGRVGAGMARTDLDLRRR